MGEFFLRRTNPCLEDPVRRRSASDEAVQWLVLSRRCNFALSFAYSSPFPSLIVSAVLQDPDAQTALLIAPFCHGLGLWSWNYDSDRLKICYMLSKGQLDTVHSMRPLEDRHGHSIQGELLKLVVIFTFLTFGSVEFH